jgi:hypothetical protein
MESSLSASNNKDQIRHRVLLGVVATCMSLGLSGCFINRAMEVQDQICDFDSNFSLKFGDSAKFNFHSPVLLDRDILWIAGASPTTMTGTEDELSMVFVLEKSDPNPRPEDEIHVDLKFDRIDDQYKLVNVRFDPMFSTLINPEILDKATIDSATQTMCELGWSFASTSVEMDISDQDLDELPNRAEILDWLGPPLEADERNDSITYEYKLKGDEPDSMKARFTVWFDETGEKPARMDSQYSHFQTSADFINKKMLLKVKI